MHFTNPLVLVILSAANIGIVGAIKCVPEEKQDCCYPVGSTWKDTAQISNWIVDVCQIEEKLPGEYDAGSYKFTCKDAPTASGNGWSNVMFGVYNTHGTHLRVSTHDCVRGLEQVMLNCMGIGKDDRGGLVKLKDNATFRIDREYLSLDQFLNFY